MLMCGGDGLADILGRKYGKSKLPWSRGKSWIGSLGMLLGGWIFSVFVLAIYVTTGNFPQPITSYLPAISLIAIAGTLVESLPFHDIDNLTVTLSAVVIGIIVF
jgi:phytol kinase